MSAAATIFPGTPSDGQTVPSKFSERNAALAKLPTTVLLSEKQRTAVVRSVGGALVQQINPKFADEIPSDIALNDLPQEVADLPALRGLKYIRLTDRIILVDSATRRMVAAVTYPSN